MSWRFAAFANKNAHQRRSDLDRCETTVLKSAPKNRHYVVCGKFINPACRFYADLFTFATHVCLFLLAFICLIWR
jgi:hypothetical protein